MALVFKINYQNTLRRWIASEALDEATFSLTLEQVEAKIRELFNLPPATELVVTYVDSENDVITLGDDRDLKDACLVQRLNPLRLEVRVKVGSSSRRPPPAQPPNKDIPESSSWNQRQAPPFGFAGNMDVESFLKSNFPHVTLDNIKQFTNTFAPNLNLKLPLAQAIEEAVKHHLGHLGGSGSQQTSKWGHHGGSMGAEKDAKKHTNDDNPANKHSNRPGPHSFHTRSRSGKDVPINDQQAVHQGVQCDGCGMQPIEGPRYKSTKLQDYDLCSKCFEGDGKQNDFQRIEHPVPPFHGFHSRPWARPWVMGRGYGRPPFTRGPYGWKSDCMPPMRNASGGDGPHGRKLDARFVRDVSIFDGTELAPGTKFTKIWCLRNSGTMPWPQNTQLMHIGGDTLSNEATARLELPEGGHPCDQEVEASVDLIAPERPGRYVSYWRLVSPLGQKFGHRVWVEIQVVPQGEDSPQLQASLMEKKTDKEEHAYDGSHLTHESSSHTTDDSSSHVIDDVSRGVFDADVLKDSTITAHETIVDAPVGEQPFKKDIEINEGPTTGEETFYADIVSAPFDKQQSMRDVQTSGKEVDGFSVVENPFESAPHAALVAGLDEGFSVVEKSTLDEGFSIVEKPVENAPTATLAASRENPLETAPPTSTVAAVGEGFSVVEKPVENSPTTTTVATLDEQGGIGEQSRDDSQHIYNEELRALESMGFTNQELNMVLLEKNNGKLQPTLDELLVSAGWDGQLSDLQEMGFPDRLTNIRLLVKNNGSLKRVVKDLLEAEKKSSISY